MTLLRSARSRSKAACVAPPARPEQAIEQLVGAALGGDRLVRAGVTHVLHGPALGARPERLHAHLQRGEVGARGQPAGDDLIDRRAVGPAARRRTGCPGSAGSRSTARPWPARARRPASPPCGAGCGSTTRSCLKGASGSRSLPAGIAAAVDHRASAVSVAVLALGQNRSGTMPFELNTSSRRLGRAGRRRPAVQRGHQRSHRRRRSPGRAAPADGHGSRWWSFAATSSCCTRCSCCCGCALIAERIGHRRWRRPAPAPCTRTRGTTCRTWASERVVGRLLVATDGEPEPLQRHAVAHLVRGRPAVRSAPARP